MVLSNASFRIWNYVIKGFIGSLLVLIFFPLLCIANFFVCTVLAITSIVWYATTQLFFWYCLVWK